MGKFQTSTIILLRAKRQFIGTIIPLIKSLPQTDTKSNLQREIMVVMKLLFKKKKNTPRDPKEILDKILTKMRDSYSNTIILPPVQFPPLIKSEQIMGDYLRQNILIFECSGRSQLVNTYVFAKIVFHVKEFLIQNGIKSEFNEWIFEYCHREFSKSYINNLIRFYLFTDKYKKVLGTALSLNEVINNIKLLTDAFDRNIVLASEWIMNAQDVASAQNYMGLYKYGDFEMDNELLNLFPPIPNNITNTVFDSANFVLNQNLNFPPNQPNPSKNV